MKWATRYILFLLAMTAPGFGQVTLRPPSAQDLKPRDRSVHLRHCHDRRDEPDRPEQGR